jgi:hypothetical protein
MDWCSTIIQAGATHIGGRKLDFRLRNGAGLRYSINTLS